MSTYPQLKKNVVREWQWFKRYGKVTVKRKKGDRYIVFGRKVCNLILMLAWDHLVRGIWFSPITACTSESACQNVCVIAIYILTAPKSMSGIVAVRQVSFDYVPDWLICWLFKINRFPKGNSILEKISLFMFISHSLLLPMMRKTFFIQLGSLCYKLDKILLFSHLLCHSPQMEA